MTAFLRKTILDVPFKEKDEAKALGAWWDPKIRKWYVPQGLKPEPFARWLPVEAKEHVSTTTEESADPSS